MAKNILKVIIMFLIGAVGGIFADQIFWPYFVERPLFLEYNLEQSPVYITETKKITVQENIALQDAIEKVENSVVGIRTKTKKGKDIEGSGLIITADGLIVTLAEMAPEGSSFSIWLKGSKEKISGAKVLKRDIENNLAFIKIENARLKTVGFADFEKIKLGQRVFLVGALFQQEGSKKSSLITTVNIVNQGIIKYFNQDLIHTNIFEKTAIAGSPLFDIEGRVLGINLIDKQGKVITIPCSKIREFIGF